MIFQILDHFIKIIIGVLLADFIMGIYHWIKDTYFSPFTPFIGKTFIWNSRLHHIRPRYVTEFSDWDLFWSSTKWTFIWMGPLFYANGISPLLVSLYITIGMNDVIHKYSHLTDKERSYWVTLFQRMYIFQSHDEHHLHHVSPHDLNYCPITPFLNIILEQIDFWKKAEHLIEYYLGYNARDQDDKFIEQEGYPAGIKFIEP